MKDTVCTKSVPRVKKIGTHAEEQHPNPSFGYYRVSIISYLFQSSQKKNDESPSIMGIY